jgi:hypothetical protein
VTAIRANRIVVVLDEGDYPVLDDANDVLTRSAESLGIESLDDPLA